MLQIDVFWVKYQFIKPTPVFMILNPIIGIMIL